EVYVYYEKQDYYSQIIYDADHVLQRILNAFIDGMIPNIEFEGREIFDSLVHYNDEYFLLRDFSDYCRLQEKIDHYDKEQKLWLKKSLINIVNAGEFTADKAVREYAQVIWQIEPIFVNTKKEGTTNGYGKI